MIFTGEYRARLNAKHQVTLPSPLREAVFSTEGSSPLVLFSREDGQYLELFPSQEWEVIQRKTELVARQKKRPELNRVLNARAYPISLESGGNGRILIPKVYATYFKPDGDVVFIGNTKKIELWNTKQYEAMQSDARANFQEEMDQIFDY